MGRPPVRPEDRKRSAKACITCRATKKRCDGASPCRPCLNRGNGTLCEYSQQRRTRRPARRPDAQLRQHTPSTLESRSEDPSSPVSQRQAASCSRRVQDPSRRRDSAVVQVPPGPRPVMMYTCSGEKVFVGNASAISFLQFLRGSLSNILGSNGFTISQGSHSMFEAQAPAQASDSFEDDIDADEKRALIQLFLDASSGLLDLFDRSEIDHMLAKFQSPRKHNRHQPAMSSSARDSENQASLYMMIAIGAQCRGQPDDLPKAFRYFSQARKLSFQGFLTDLTLNTARSFVLMAFYMFGACRRNAAFMYLGVATKAASVLGLHMSDQFQSLPGEEQRLRSRIDRSIRLFDVICSSILGRPTSSLPVRESTNAIHLSLAHRAQSVGAACQLSSIMNRIVDKISSDGHLGIPNAEAFLEDIREWSSSLPATLRRGLQRTTTGIPESSDRETTIGNIHVACSYYFAVITTTREFLIQHIMPQVEGKTDHSDFSWSQYASQDNEKVAELSGVCVDAAAFMAEMCSEGLDSGIIMGNMCILKAWLFAAGLILGFSLLDSAAGVNNRSAFRNTLRLLEFLGRLSPQAGQYHRVLTSFSQALDTFKSQSAPGRRSSALYVERLLSFDTIGSAQKRQQTPLSQSAGPSTLFESSQQTTMMQDVVSEDSLPVQSGFDPLDFGGEDLILSLLWEGEGTIFPEPGSLDGSLAIY
ncbi:C6 transcription factor [Colletotrichum plurivorum]|uniref:C6 transcription factor n=1 Tax=Colletotrichum plurivorum TaxID=2175906 RepID=A0A8H6K1P5_9PEZI|nr:C6 transcription factor [Colletotrichum plurivorum]